MKLRYVSRRERPATVKDRIEDVWKRTPPPKGRKARKAHASKDDFAAILGVGRNAVYTWTRTKNPAYPDEKGRAALAKASRGRYRPEDFERPSEPEMGSLELRMARVEQALEALERKLMRLIGEDAAPGS